MKAIMKTQTRWALLALAGVACNGGPYRAVEGDTVSVTPSDITFLISSAFDEEDNVGQVDILDITVYDSEGIPKPSTEVEVQAPSWGLYVIPDGAVRLVDYPYAPDDWQTARDDVCKDDSGAFDNTEEWCAWYYDTLSGQYYQFGSEYADADTSDYDGYKPDYLIGETDSYGQLRIYSFLDAVAIDRDVNGDVTGALPQQLYITIRVADTEAIYTGQE